MKVYTLSLLFLVLASGCTSVPGYFYMNNARFDSPEAIGKAGGFELAGSYQNSTKVVVDRDITTDPPGSSGALIGDDADAETFTGEDLNFIDNLYHNFKVGLTERLDIGFDFAVGDLPRVLKIKYQFMGESQLAADQDNVSGSVVFGLGYGSRDIDESYSAGSFNGELTYYTATASFIIGRRVQPRWLLYYNLTGSLYDSELDIERNLTVGGVSDYNYESDGHQVLSLFGTRIFFNDSSTFFMGVEAGFSFVDWDNADSEEEFALGLSIGGVF